MKTGDLPITLVVYYFIMMFLNVAGYLVASFMSYRLAALLETSRLYIGLRRMSVMFAVFGLIRLASGVDGIIEFVFGLRDTSYTVAYLGVVSLLLNTSFICSFAVFLTVEVNRIYRVYKDHREVVDQTTKAFETLRKASSRHRRLDTSDV